MYTACELGLSGPSRLHEQFVAVEASTPGQYKRHWRDVEIRYGFAQCPFGEMLIARTASGICLLSFVKEQNRTRELDRLQRLYGLARLRRDDAAARATPARLFEGSDAPAGTFQLAVRGTNFQVSVWRALLCIPHGQTLSYRQLAGSLGRADAVRAVAGAVAANPVNYLIPCHRVLRANGDIGGFRGGGDTKRRLLEWESAGAADASRAVQEPGAPTALSTRR